MLNIPVEIKNLLKTNTATKNFRVTFPNGERADIINENLVAESVHFTESVMSQDKFKLGLCESPVIEFEAFNIENIKGKKIECYYEIYCDSTVDDAVYRDDLDAYVYPIPLGVFYVDSCQKEAKMNMRRVVAYGEMSHFDCRPPRYSYWFFDGDLTDFIALVLQTPEFLSNLQLDHGANPTKYRRLRYLLCASNKDSTYNRYWQTYRGLWHNIPSKQITLSNLVVRQGNTFTPLNITVTKELYRFVVDEYYFKMPNGGMVKQFCAQTGIFSKLNKNSDIRPLTEQFKSYINTVIGELMESDPDTWGIYKNNIEPSLDDPLIKEVSVGASLFTSNYWGTSGWEDDSYFYGRCGYGFKVINSSGIKYAAYWPNVSDPTNYYGDNADETTLTESSDIRLMLRKDYPISSEMLDGDLYLKRDDGTYSSVNLSNNGSLFDIYREYFYWQERYATLDYSNALSELSSILEVMYSTEWLNDNNPDNWQVFDGYFTHDFFSRPIIDDADPDYVNLVAFDPKSWWAPLEPRVYIQDFLEIQGRMARFDRRNEINLFNYDTTALYPAETLYPSDELYPDGTSADTIMPSEYETAWYDDELSLPYGAFIATRTVNGRSVTTTVYADGYDRNTPTNTYQIYDISENTYVKGASDTEITTYLTNIKNAIQKFRYMPSDIDMVGRPDLETSDGIEVMTYDGAFDTYVFSRTIEGIQGLSDNMVVK